MRQNGTSRAKLFPAAAPFRVPPLYFLSSFSKTIFFFAPELIWAT